MLKGRTWLICPLHFSEGPFAGWSWVPLRGPPRLGGLQLVLPRAHPLIAPRAALGKQPIPVGVAVPGTGAGAWRLAVPV